MSIATAPLCLKGNDKIGILSHVDLDGVASAMIVRSAVDVIARTKNVSVEVDDYFIGYSRGIGDKLIEALDGKDYDLVFITDISIRNNDKGKPDMALFLDMVRRNSETTFIWYDHHAASQVELIPDDLINLTYRVETDESKYKCGADIAYEELWAHSNLIENPFATIPLYRGCPATLANAVTRVKDLAHDYDITKPDGEWRQDIPESVDMSDVIASIGPRETYERLIDNPALVYPGEYMYDVQFAEAIESERKGREYSLALAKSTTKSVDVGGHKINLGICCGHPSEAGHVVAGNDPEVAALVLDISSYESSDEFRPSISLRRANHSQVNLATLAKRLGGGGHPFAAGGRIDPKRLLLALRDELEAYVKECLS